MRIRKKKDRRLGFSLVELMVVVAILGILATVVAVNVLGQTHKAKLARVRLDFVAIDNAITLYHTDMGRYPEELENLLTAPADDEAGNWGPKRYLKTGIPKDPWNNPYVYSAESSTDGTYELITYGADGRPGGEGDDADRSIQEMLWASGETGGVTP